jgi:hypothetical protein
MVVVFYIAEFGSLVSELDSLISELGSLVSELGSLISELEGLHGKKFICLIPKLGVAITS